MYFIGLFSSAVNKRLTALLIESADTKVAVPMQFEIRGSSNGQPFFDLYEILLFENYLNKDLEIMVSRLENLFVSSFHCHKCLMSPLSSGNNRTQWKKPAIGVGCVGVKETDDFEQLVSRMSILRANRVGLDVEILEQVEGGNVMFSHRVCLYCYMFPLHLLTSTEQADDHGQLRQVIVPHESGKWQRSQLHRRPGQRDLIRTIERQGVSDKSTGKQIHLIHFSLTSIRKRTETNSQSGRK